MKNKVRLIRWQFLVVFLVVGLAVFAVRHNYLNRQLLEAIQSQQPASVVCGLLRQGANPNMVDSYYGDSALFRAVSNGKADTVQALLDAGASKQKVGPAAVGPIFAVTKSKFNQMTETQCYAIIKELQSRGESIEERDKLGLTPLMRVVWSGNTVATKALLELGADRSVRDNNGQSVWDMTYNSPPQHDELMKLLRVHAKGTHRS
jgi:ankyrin repeat protein